MIKQDKPRVEAYYKERFESYVNEERVRQDESTLHPGFDKICGLKGSKLSGGQK